MAHAEKDYSKRTLHNLIQVLYFYGFFFLSSPSLLWFRGIMMSASRASLFRVTGNEFCLLTSLRLSLRGSTFMRAIILLNTPSDIDTARLAKVVFGSPAQISSGRTLHNVYERTSRFFFFSFPAPFLLHFLSTLLDNSRMYRFRGQIQHRGIRWKMMVLVASTFFATFKYEMPSRILARFQGHCYAGDARILSRCRMLGRPVSCKVEASHMTP